MIAANRCARIPDENFTAMTRLDQNRARTQLAQKAGVPVSLAFKRAPVATKGLFGTVGGPSAAGQHNMCARLLIMHMYSICAAAAPCWAAKQPDGVA